MRKRILILLVLGLSLEASAQDIHFSQFYETAVLRNPALIGINTPDYKVVAQLRNQWTNVGRGFRTNQISGEFRIAAGRGSSDYISIGLLGYMDKAGAIDFRTIGIYPAINYNKYLDDQNNTYLSLGFTGGHVGRTFDISKMTFDNQYQNGGYDPGNSNGEQQMPNANISHLDIGTGISLNGSSNEQLSYYLGVAAYHFTKPKRSFYTNRESINLQTRWSLNAGFNWAMDETWSVQVHANYMRQGPAQEIMAGGFIKWSQEGYDGEQAFGLSGGVSFRLLDAIIPMLKIDYKGQSFGFSYDINTSTLKDLTKMRGGFEITVFHSGLFKGGGSGRQSAPRF